jgi:hypothetical protein
VQSIKDTIDPNKIRHIQDVGASFPVASRLIGMSKQAETYCERVSKADTVEKNCLQLLHCL